MGEMIVNPKAVEALNSKIDTTETNITKWESIGVNVTGNASSYVNYSKVNRKLRLVQLQLKIVLATSATTLCQIADTTIYPKDAIPCHVFNSNNSTMMPAYLATTGQVILLSVAPAPINTYICVLYSY